MQVLQPCIRCALGHHSAKCGEEQITLAHSSMVQAKQARVREGRMCHAYAWAAGLYLHAKASLNRGGPPLALASSSAHMLSEALGFS